jgi:hypothetical protein
MRITVDGKPLDDPGKCTSDVQRCTDVALDKADIQFKHDSLRLEPRLNVTAWPRTIRYQDLADTPFAENLVRFRLYTNYRSFIERAEVRIFEEEQSVPAIRPWRSSHGCGRHGPVAGGVRHLLRPAAQTALHRAGL